MEKRHSEEDPTLSLLLNVKDKKTKKPLLTKSQKDFAKKLDKALKEKDKGEVTFE